MMGLDISKPISHRRKDRSAIGLAGHSGTAYMHSTTTGRFITSDYYNERISGLVESILPGTNRRRAAYAGEVTDSQIDGEAPPFGLESINPGAAMTSKVLI
jgi:hypothetical protein